MSQNFLSRFWKWTHADFLSPKDFVRHAAMIVVVFGMAHLAGLREYTSFLNGTPGATDMDPRTAAVLGLIYLLLYLCAVLLAPIFLITAGLIAAVRRINSHG